MIDDSHLSNINIEFPIRLWKPYVCLYILSILGSKYLSPETQIHTLWAHIVGSLCYLKHFVSALEFDLCIK